MPVNPSHEGLTAQGWNWSSAIAKRYVTNHGILDIGQNYTTSDGATRIYTELQDDYCSPYLTLGIDGTVTIDWGDGTTPSTATGSSLTTEVSTRHQYAKGGKYVISISGGSINFISKSWQESNSASRFFPKRLLSGSS